MVVEADLAFASDFSEGRAVVLMDGKWGFINEEGDLMTGNVF